MFPLTLLKTNPATKRRENDRYTVASRAFYNNIINVLLLLLIMQLLTSSKLWQHFCDDNSITNIIAVAFTANTNSKNNGRRTLVLGQL